MSETILKFFLAELAIIRVPCVFAKCGAVLEIPIDKIVTMEKALQCPVCSSIIPVGNGTGENNLQALARVIKDLKANGIKIEFVAPAPAKDQS